MAFSCPDCEVKLKVLESRTRSPTKIYRRHRCPKCGRRFSTIEVLNTTRVWGHALRDGGQAKSDGVIVPTKVEKKLKPLLKPTKSREEVIARVRFLQHKKKMLAEEEEDFE